jgi:glycosyltransferase involved in cell wall biosynthesis
MKPTVSVLYCTARHGGLDILMESMNCQTFQDFEVVIVDELKRNTEDYGRLIPQTNFHWVEPPPKKPGMFWNLSASLNEGVRHCKGEIIILLQDYIFIPEEGVAKLVEVYQKDSPCLVSGVGHQFEFPKTIDDPKGLYSVWNSFPGRPSGDKIFTDPRIKGKGIYVCTPVEWEANYACFGKEVWEKIGGFDEDFDAGWGYDNVNFAERAQLAGFNTFLDMENECLCYSHINLFGEKEHRDKSPNNQKLWYKKYQDLHYHPETAWKLNYAG